MFCATGLVVRNMRRNKNRPPAATSTLHSPIAAMKSIWRCLLIACNRLACRAAAAEATCSPVRGGGTGDQVPDGTLTTLSGANRGRSSSRSPKPALRSESLGDSGNPSLRKPWSKEILSKFSNACGSGVGSASRVTATESVTLPDSTVICCGALIIIIELHLGQFAI